jgi:hypothetical protein
MDTTSNALKNRLEIIYYAFLTSCLSGVDRIRELNNPQLKESQDSRTDEEQTPFVNHPEFPENTKLSYWTYLSQSLIPLLMWIILGFAAGFLIGLINPK